MFEHRHEKVLPLRLFVRRMFKCGTIAVALVAFSLGLGICGYHYFADLPWVDALLNASMILAGMGPVDELHSSGAKLFASGYAIFSGLVLISVMALLLGPVAHRVLHKFHLADEDLNEDERADETEKKPRRKPSR